MSSWLPSARVQLMTRGPVSGSTAAISVVVALVDVSPADGVVASSPAAASVELSATASSAAMSATGALRICAISLSISATLPSTMTTSRALPSDCWAIHSVRAAGTKLSSAPAVTTASSLLAVRK
ncbi:MAG: hypothetical protein K0R03_8 [Moraxellaceae bacterium]|nr:hypothetical protein [Moraxellaceae bacterium]